MPNRLTNGIIELLNKGDKLDEKLILSRERELINAYRKSLKNIRFQISEMYRKYGDKVTFEYMTTYNRLTNLEQSIAKELKELTRTSIKTIKSSITNGYEQTYNYTAFAAERTLQLKMAFGEVPKSTLEAAIFNPMDRITWIERQTDNGNVLLKQLRQEIAQGLIEGKGYAKTAKAVTERMNVGITQAKRVVWTETHRAQQAARSAGLDRTLQFARDEGIEARKHWNATLDSRTRPNHGAMESVEPNEDGLFLFTTKSGGQILVDNPGETGIDSINCRCSLSMRFEDFPPKTRRRTEDKKVIPYQTYNEWAEARK